MLRKMKTIFFYYEPVVNVIRNGLRLIPTASRLAADLLRLRSMRVNSLFISINSVSLWCVLSLHVTQLVVY